MIPTRVHILTKKHFDFDVLYRPKTISLGGTIGTNRTVNKKMANVYLEIDILFWTLGFEINWEYRYKVPRDGTLSKDGYFYKPWKM
jgi:hypothetical protein